MPSFEVRGVKVGDEAPVFLVAELSANHAGKRDVALRTVEAAAKAGANAIKLQTYTPDTLTLKSAAEPFVVKTKNVWAGRTLHDLYAEAMTPWEWHQEIKACVESLGLVFFSTPFDPTAVEFLEALDVAVHKVASFELVDLPLVDHVARRKKPMILSTGMASLGEIEAAVKTCRAAGNDALALLRCVSSYPARPEMMNLQSFVALASFGTVVGLSDHTRESTVAIASVALGAKIIEKHFILDRSIGGPDAFFSLEPSEFKSLVEVVRATESALGKPRFGASEDEKASTAFRRSLFVAEDVREGDVLTATNVRSVRPAHGLPTKHLPEVLGRVATRAASAGTPLTWGIVGGPAPLPTVTLRLATVADGGRLLAWRNDPDTRKMSATTGEISPADHEAWLGRSLDDPTRKLFIAEAAGVAVGQVRLDADAVDRTVHEVSIAVAPEARGKGFAAALLVGAEGEARAMGARLLTARIKQENTKSRRAFERAGYYAFIERDQGGVAYAFCERHLAAYGA